MRKQKVFQGTPEQLEELLNEGWYIEKVLHSHYLGEVYYRTENIQSTQNVIILVAWLSQKEKNNVE